MNRKNIQKVRDHIASLPRTRFAMDAYFGERVNEDGDRFVVTTDLTLAAMKRATNRRMVEGACNTCACIAGHALARLEPNARIPAHVAGRAEKLLGLSWDVAGRLFEPNNHDAWFRANMRLEQVTLPHAVRVLDHLLATGEVDWKSTRRAKPAAA